MGLESVDDGVAVLFEIAMNLLDCAIKYNLYSIPALDGDDEVVDCLVRDVTRMNGHFSLCYLLEVWSLVVDRMYWVSYYLLYWVFK